MKFTPILQRSLVLFLTLGCLIPITYFFQFEVSDESMIDPIGSLGTRILRARTLESIIILSIFIITCDVVCLTLLVKHIICDRHGCIRFLMCIAYVIASTAATTLPHSTTSPYKPILYAYTNTAVDVASILRTVATYYGYEECSYGAPLVVLYVAGQLCTLLARTAHTMSVVLGVIIGGYVCIVHVRRMPHRPTPKQHPYVPQLMEAYTDADLRVPTMDPMPRIVVDTHTDRDEFNAALSTIEAAMAQLQAAARGLDTPGDLTRYVLSHKKDKYATLPIMNAAQLVSDQSLSAMFDQPPEADAVLP